MIDLSAYIEPGNHLHLVWEKKKLAYNFCGLSYSCTGRGGKRFPLVIIITTCAAAMDEGGKKVLIDLCLFITSEGKETRQQQQQQ